MMRALARRLRVAARDQAGMTLPELMISISMMVIVATIFTTVVLSIQQAVVRQQARSEINDEARLAMQALDREVRSGSHLFVADGAHTCGGKDCQPNYSLRVYTQANLPTRGQSHCVQWVIDGQKLYRRSWVTGSATTLNGWRMVGDGIVNREAGVNTPAFTIDPTPGGDVLDVTLMVNSRYGAQGAPSTVRMNTSIAIRNSGTGDPCTPVPSS